MPWDLLPVSTTECPPTAQLIAIILQLGLSLLWNIANLIIPFIRWPVHAGVTVVTVAYDLFLWIALFIGGLVATASAIYTFQWNAAQWYNDATSAHDGYYAYAEDGSGRGRIFVSPKNATVCSGFNDCTEQDAFTSWTHHRAVVELVGCAFTWLAM